jgi:TM2 domain-containing membrane protein YozV
LLLYFSHHTKAQGKPHKTERFMKRIQTYFVLSFAFFLFASYQLIAQSNELYHIYLKDGRVAKGEITENIPNEFVRIKNADGKAFVFTYPEIQKIVPDSIENRVRSVFITLKNGVQIRGLFLQSTPNQSITIQTANGTTQCYTYDEIQTIRYSNKPLLPKKPGAAFVNSLLFPGLGQFYNGQKTKGIIFSSIGGGSLAVATYCAITMSHKDEPFMEFFIGGISAVVFSLNYLASLIDAPISASKINKKHKNGMLSWSLGKESQLGISPKFTFRSLNHTEKMIGLKLRLSL